MNNLDDYFQEVAFSMGYKAEDLLPIDRIVLELESAQRIKGMSNKQKDYYLNKKMATLLQRQNKIFHQVEKQIKRRQYTYKLSSHPQSKLHNPAVMKLLEEHQKLINKNKKYLDILFKKKEIDQLTQSRKKMLSQQRQRKTDQSFRSNRSTVSNRSNRSSSSQRSTESNRERLMMIRQKQSQEQQQKKKALKQKMQQDSKKSLRAIENISRKSQRTKTKTAINQQIVEQNKKELDFIKNLQIKEHLQRLKFKIQQTEMIRSKHRPQPHPKPLYDPGKSLKHTLEEEKKKIMQSRLDEKTRTASFRFQHQEVLRTSARNFNKMIEQQKHHNAQQNRLQKNQEKLKFINSLMTHQQLRMRTAEVNRNNLKSLSKERYLEQDVKQDIARKNLESVNNRRFRYTQQIRKKLDNKFEEIKEIDEIKKKLNKERQKIKKDYHFERKSLEINNYRPKFNSFFDL